MLPQLIGTPLSHFTRKVRVVLAELAIPYDFVRADGVLATATANYGDNPLLRVPAWRDGDVTLFDSDHIARYLVARHDPADRLGVLACDRPAALNQLAIANGVMANEVVLILAACAGFAELDRVAYFTKLRGAIANGLAWLDAHVDADAAFAYPAIATACAWQHVRHYALVPTDGYPRLAAYVARLAERPSLAATAPA